MNSMIEFAKNNRTTEYFRDFAIVEIRVAYRIMEYLAQDSVFPTKNLVKETMNLMLSENFEGAYTAVKEEVDNVLYTELGSSHGYENLRIKGIELMRYLLPLYKLNCKDIKEQKRIKLIEELKELDSEGVK